MAALCSAAYAAVAGAVSLDLAAARLEIGPKANPSLQFADGSRWPATENPAFLLETDQTVYPAKSAEFTDDTLSVRFRQGALTRAAPSTRRAQKQIPISRHQAGRPAAGPAQDLRRVPEERGLAPNCAGGGLEAAQNR